MLPNARLGKRSPLGALLSSTCSTCLPGGCSSQVDFHCGVAGDPDAPLSSCRSVSSSIDVPRSAGRSRPEAEMDELMAAMILSSLSCSPLLHSPAHQEPPGPLVDGAGGEFSDGGSSGYWSVGHAHQSPHSSPHATEEDEGVATSPLEGLDMELDPVLLDEPAPRKWKNSQRVAFRCLWPGCQKVLTTTVGIKRHIRTSHLCLGGDHERCSHSEEDFYYTEVSQWECPQPQTPPTPVSLGLCTVPSSPPSCPSPPTLSCSAPSTGSCWQVQSEHSYQAPPPSHIALATSASPCVAPPTSCTRQGVSFRARSFSVGEQWLQHHSAPSRKVRGEARKCRKVYGIEHRELWCTACRWKKACQRFLD